MSTDIARSIQSLLEKLTEDEKDAFNFVLELSRRQPQTPRLYTVVLRHSVLDERENFTATTRDTEREVWAYDYDEALKQVHRTVQAEGPPTDPTLMPGWVFSCAPSIPEGTKS